jgi:hypothetical protein
MIRHADHHEGLEALPHEKLAALGRTNRALVLGILWGALAFCVIGSVVYDAGHLLQAW